MFDKQKADWIDALTFSNYKQGKGKLRQKVNDTDRFCCLGVLCNIQEGVQWLNEDEDNYNNVVYHNPTVRLENGDLCLIGYMGMLTTAGHNMFGLSGEQTNYLAFMNDNGKTFEEIAEWIRVNV